MEGYKAGRMLLYFAGVQWWTVIHTSACTVVQKVVMTVLFAACCWLCGIHFEEGDDE